MITQKSVSLASNQKAPKEIFFNNSKKRETIMETKCRVSHASDKKASNGEVSEKKQNEISLFELKSKEYRILIDDTINAIYNKISELEVIYGLTETFEYGMWSETYKDEGEVEVFNKSISRYAFMCIWNCPSFTILEELSGEIGNLIYGKERDKLTKAETDLFQNVIEQLEQIPSTYDIRIDSLEGINEASDELLDIANMLEDICFDNL